MRMQPKIVTHFLTYYINWLISLWFTRRRRASQKGNSHAENAPNAPTSEMPSRVNSELSQYATVQSEASAPAQSTNASTSLAPAPRYSQHDTTLIENDLYVNRGVFKLNWTDFNWPTTSRLSYTMRHYADWFSQSLVWRSCNSGIPNSRQDYGMSPRTWNLLL